HCNAALIVCALILFVYRLSPFLLFFFVDDPATPPIYTLSLHDALPIFQFEVALQHMLIHLALVRVFQQRVVPQQGEGAADPMARSEEHTSELQSRENLVCRLLLEKKKRAHS